MKETENKKEEQRKQLSLRLPPDIHRRAKIRAAKEGVTIQAVLERLLREWLEKEPEE